MKSGKDTVIPQDVFRFSDYRAFLRAHAQDAKARNARWSYGAWARHLKLSGTAALTMVINGQRHPGPKMTELLIRYFQFSPKQQEHFLDLIELQKVKSNPRLSVLLMERLSQRLPRGEFKLLDADSFSAISHWHFYAIREMTSLTDFREDAEWIAKKLKFKVAPREIKRAIGILLKLNLLARAPDGALRISSGTVDTVQDVADEAVKRYHEQTLELARKSVRESSVLERELSATTFNLLEQDLPKAKELIRKFQDDFCRAIERSPGDRTYQLQIQLFPLTETSSKGKKENLQ